MTKKKLLCTSLIKLKSVQKNFKLKRNPGGRNVLKINEKFESETETAQFIY